MRSRRIDLHGFTVDAAIVTFVARYNALVAEGYRGSVEVIHGYGSSGEGGAIRRKLRAYLAAHRDRFRHLSEGDAIGNPGVTFVEPKGRLPVMRSGGSELEIAIVAFCATPKTEAKILTRFVGRYGDPAVRTAIRQLLNEGALERTDDFRLLRAST